MFLDRLCRVHYSAIYCIIVMFSRIAINSAAGESLANSMEIYSSKVSYGLKDLFQAPVFSENVLGIKYGRASDIVKSSGFALPSVPLASESASTPSFESTLPLEISLSKIVRKYGERILLQESDRKPRISKRRGRRQPSPSWKSKDHLAMVNDWQGPPPWDSSGGGDECPRFLCDVMVWASWFHLVFFILNLDVDYSVWESQHIYFPWMEYISAT